MFANNIGAGQSGIIACADVNVAPKNPRGDIIVDTVGSQIRVNGWLIDDSNPQQSVGLWIVDNGKVVASFISNAPSPYLHPYGVFGNHAFGSMWTPSTSGTHNICVMGLNIGFGENTWIECGTVSVTLPDPTKDDPKGIMDISVYDADEPANGLNDVFIDVLAYDPNDYNQALTYVLFFDGKIIYSDVANWDSSWWNPYGVWGDHGDYIFLGEAGNDLPFGKHEICLYVNNYGPGKNSLVQCENVTL